MMFFSTVCFLVFDRKDDEEGFILEATFFRFVDFSCSESLSLPSLLPRRKMLRHEPDFSSSGLDGGGGGGEDASDEEKKF